MGGQNAVIIAVDTIKKGHITTYPSDDQTVAIQIPFANGLLPDHEVAYGGPCQDEEDINDASVTQTCFSGLEGARLV